jgi:mannose-6-phosphate isomerase-like protein (cupin superfamily)
MKLIPLALAIALSASIAAAQDGGITVWTKGVPPPTAVRADFGDHTLTVGHRDKNGRVELHRNKADVLIIQSGTATLVTGGEVVDPITTGPNEIQGSSIKGGVKREIGPGDVIEIPAGVPHQFFIAPGTQITYVAVKIIKHADSPPK